MVQRESDGAIWHLASAANASNTPNILGICFLAMH